MSRLLLLAALAACGGKDADEPKDPAEWEPDLWCPGSQGCADSPGAPLEAGVAVRSVVPDCYESWEDADGNATWVPPGEPFLDCGSSGHRRAGSCSCRQRYCHAASQVQQSS